MADDEIRNVLREVQRTQARVPDAPEGFDRILRDGVLTLDLAEVGAWVQQSGGRVESELLAAPPLGSEADSVTPEVGAPDKVEYPLVPQGAPGGEQTMKTVLIVGGIISWISLLPKFRHGGWRRGVPILAVLTAGLVVASMPQTRGARIACILVFAAALMPLRWWLFHRWPPTPPR